jgi:putative colanic acid biosynthesis glycosyltransferase
MRILQINTYYKAGGSTGRIVADLSTIINEKHTSYVAFGYEFLKTNDQNTYKVQGIINLKLSILKTRIFGKHGFYNKYVTWKLIRWIKKIKPDVIHLHNIHNHYINIEQLFSFIKTNNYKVVWTLHDCWSFTGWCAYFDYVNCNKWQTECNNCPSLKSYPYTWFFDRSKEIFNSKKEIFQGVNSLTIITPSSWLKGLVSKSILKEYPVSVINNGIDLDVFKPIKNDFRKNYNLVNKTIVLAMAMKMNKRKGIEYLKKLPSLLDENTVLVLVGISKSEINNLPKNCLGIEQTANVGKLVEIYSSADVFINLTLEDNFPTTNLEALGCGTPVITFDTGGSPESIDVAVGEIVKKGDLTEVVKAIKRITDKGKDFYTSACREKAQLNYDNNKQYKKYIELYESLN